MRISIITLSITIGLFPSCHDRAGSQDDIQSMSTYSLNKSNEAIKKLSKINHHEILNKLHDPSFKAKAEFWGIRASKLEQITVATINNLEPLKIQKDNAYDTIMALRKNYFLQILSLDDKLSQIVGMPLATADSTTSIPNAFFVAKTKNDILLAESAAAEYFNNNISAIIDSYTSFSAILSQNSKHFKSGDSLIIQTGIGALTTSNDPIFVINGNIIKPNENAYVEYKLKVSGNGKQSIPVKIEYIDKDGSRTIKNYVAEYFVDK